jgi:hypothetical protein
MTKPQRSNFIPRCLPKTAKGTSPVVATGFRPDLHLGFFTGFTCSNFPWKQKYQKHPKPPITLLRVIPTLAYYSDILSDILWHVFGSRCPPQHPELAIWCSGPGVTHCIRSRGGGGGGGTSCTFVYLNLEVRKKGLLNRDNEDKLWIWGYILRQTHIYWDRNGVSMRNHMTLKGSSRNLNGSVYPHMASWVEKFIKNQVFLGCHIFQHTNLLVSLTE